MKDDKLITLTVHFSEHHAMSARELFNIIADNWPVVAIQHSEHAQSQLPLLPLHWCDYCNPNDVNSQILQNSKYVGKHQCSLDENSTH